MQNAESQKVTSEYKRTPRALRSRAEKAEKKNHLHKVAAAGQSTVGGPSGVSLFELGCLRAPPVPLTGCRFWQTRDVFPEHHGEQRPRRV